MRDLRRGATSLYVQLYQKRVLFLELKEGMIEELGST